MKLLTSNDKYNSNNEFLYDMGPIIPLTTVYGAPWWLIAVVLISSIIAIKRIRLEHKKNLAEQHSSEKHDFDSKDEG